MALNMKGSGHSRGRTITITMILTLVLFFGGVLLVFYYNFRDPTDDEEARLATHRTQSTGQGGIPP